MDNLLTVEYVCKYLNSTGGGFALQMMAMTRNKYQQSVKTENKAVVFRSAKQQITNISTSLRLVKFKSRSVNLNFGDLCWQFYYLSDEDLQSMLDKVILPFIYKSM